MPDLDFKHTLYGLISLFLLSVGGNAWSVYKMRRMNTTIQAQMKGILDENATKIASIETSLGKVQSQMVDKATLEKKASQIIGDLDSKTQAAINKFTTETGAEITAINKSFLRMEGKLNKGISSLKSDSRPPTPAPPKSWKGVSREDRNRCSDHPERCESFEFSWRSPFSFKGRPVYTFTSKNLWADLDTNIDFNLAFKVVAITYNEGDGLGSGAVQNQGVHIYGGYIDEKGKFIALDGLEGVLMDGDPNLDQKLIYVPRVTPSNVRLGLRMFEPSLLAGSTYQGGEFGLSIGGSFLNLAKGEYRVGANFIVAQSNQYLGVMGTWHPSIAGKNLNIAPGLGWVIGADGSNTWSLGVHFQVW
jgi:hypothetical protein